MYENRPEKQAIRNLWAQILEEFSAEHAVSDVPLYLTLSGAAGRDIDLLIQRGLLSLTETGSISADHQRRVVAIESSPPAVYALQKKFPGLKILEERIENILHGPNPTTWPTGEHATLCRARIVNLDLNAPVVCEFRENELFIPVAALVQKLAQLHAATPKRDWVLYLTLHGQIPWTPQVSSAMQAFLAENCAQEPVFEDLCRQLLGHQLFDSLVQSQDVDLSQLSAHDQQKVLMALVPKKIAQLVHAQGWRVVTERNLRYGGTKRRAPMVTWILRFHWDRRSATTPQAVYREALRAVLIGAAHIAEDGSIS